MQTEKIGRSLVTGVGIHSRDDILCGLFHTQLQQPKSRQRQRLAASRAKATQLNYCSPHLEVVQNGWNKQVPSQKATAATQMFRLASARTKETHLLQCKMVGISGSDRKKPRPQTQVSKLAASRTKATQLLQPEFK